MSSSQNCMPKKVSKYEIKECLGSGAFGVVHRVVDKNTGREYAMKIISKDKIIEENLQEALKAEIVNLVSCNHANIVKLEEAMSSKKNVYLVMQYIKGVNLIDRIIDSVLTEEEARGYFIELCLALKYLKDHGIAHRDIKPENVIIDETNHVKLLDFGLSIFLSVNHNEVFQKELETPCGTLEYLAPEILKKLKYDPYASDIWSLGVVLYCMVTGSNQLSPFQSQNPTAFVKNILNPKINISVRCSQELKDLIKHMLNVNPNKRPTIEAILDNPWLGKRESLVTLDAIKPKVSRGEPHLQKVIFIILFTMFRLSHIEFTLLMFSLALKKTVTGRQNCLLLRNMTLESIRNKLRTLNSANIEAHSIVEFCTKEREKHIAIEVYWVKEKTFLLQVRGEYEDSIDQLRQLFLEPSS